MAGLDRAMTYPDSGPACGRLRGKGRRHRSPVGPAALTSPPGSCSPPRLSTWFSGPSAGRRATHRRPPRRGRACRRRRAGCRIPSRSEQQPASEPHSIRRLRSSVRKRPSDSWCGSCRSPSTTPRPSPCGSALVVVGRDFGRFRTSATKSKIASGSACIRSSCSCSVRALSRSAARARRAGSGAGSWPGRRHLRGRARATRLPAGETDGTFRAIVRTGEIDRCEE